ncbi:hypothetical protein M7I_4268 [Glarea lozoyensis 74030]|nr:hypothetical protein M7I_4268 [Glarea lozoyensis 74030]
MIYARPHRKDGRKRKERKVPQHYKRLKYYKDGTPRGNGGSWNAQTWWEEQAKRAWKQRGIVLDITSPFQRPENSYTFRPIDTIIGSMGNQHLMIDSYSLDDLAEQTKLLAESAANHSSDVETPSDDGNNDEDEEFIRNLDANNQASLAAEGISLGMNWEMNDDDLIYMDDDDDVKGWLDDMDSDEAEDGDGDETDASMDLSE